MTPDPDTGHREIRELLPWWANGTLDPDRVRRVEAHLERCPACRRDAMLLTELEAALEDAPPARRPEAPPEPAPETGRARPVLPWLGWAAAAVLALALGLRPGVDRETDPGMRSTRVVPTYRLDAVRRSSSEPMIIPGTAGAEAGDFQLVLHVDLGPGALPLELLLEDAEGRTVLREPHIERLYEGRFLFVHCAASEVPPGHYVAVLRGMGPEAPEEPLRYSFRVVAPEAGDAP
jgi:hypothetical protein